tara:strand:+ start:264 stop:605 length:342 start_codon:yes stop_codon:yes gene_type:complete
MEICKNCKQQILSTDHIFRDGDMYVHSTCPDSTTPRTKELKESSQKTDNSDNSKPHSVIEREESKRGSKALAITEIYLSWSNAFWLAFQFIVVLNILALPIALIYFIIFKIFY